MCLCVVVNKSELRIKRSKGQKKVPQGHKCVCFFSRNAYVFERSEHPKISMLDCDKRRRNELDLVFYVIFYLILLCYVYAYSNNYHIFPSLLIWTETFEYCMKAFYYFAVSIHTRHSSLIVQDMDCQTDYKWVIVTNNNFVGLIK